MNTEEAVGDAVAMPRIDTEGRVRFGAGTDAHAPVRTGPDVHGSYDPLWPFARSTSPVRIGEPDTCKLGVYRVVTKSSSDAASRLRVTAAEGQLRRIASRCFRPTAPSRGRHWTICCES